MPVSPDPIPFNPTDIWSCHYDVNVSQTRPPRPGGGGPIDCSVTLNTDIFQAQVARPTDISDLNSLLSMLGEGADLAFIVYAMQIQQMDRQVAASIQEIRNTGNLRDALSKRIEQLRNTRGNLEKIDGMQDGGTANIFPDTTDGGVLRRIDYAVDADTGTVTPVTGELLGAKKDAGKSSHQISLNDIDSEIKRLEAQAQGLDSNREVKMILFNQTLNRKNQAVSELTNILKKSHETQSAVINNLR